MTYILINMVQAALHWLAKDCQYGAFSEDALRDSLVCEMIGGGSPR